MLIGNDAQNPIQTLRFSRCIRSVDADSTVPRILRTFRLGSGCPLMKTQNARNDILPRTVRAASNLKPQIKPADISLKGMHTNALGVVGWSLLRPSRGLQLITDVFKLTFWHLDPDHKVIIYEWWKACEAAGGVEQLICGTAAQIRQECGGCCSESGRTIKKDAHFPSYHTCPTGQK